MCARLEVFTVMKILLMVFWIVMPCSGVVGYHRFEASHHEDGGSKVLRNVGVLRYH